LALFKLNADPTIEGVESFNVPKEKVKKIFEAIDRAIKETIDLGIEAKQIEVLETGGIKLDVRISLKELAQVAAEVLDELTPENSLLIGVMIMQKFENIEGDYAGYVADKLNK